MIDSGIDGEHDEVVAQVSPRAYQLEMLEESRKRNVIVAMETGSGKTHVAVMRIQEELEHMPLNKLIWFLAPTVSLCSQQYGYIQSHIPSVQAKFFSGADGLDRWTEQSHWDAILKNINIVVSTHQILLDALTHGFIKMESLSLVIFDEAHGCTGRNPGTKIMQLFYHPRKAEGLVVPHILGLTATPVKGSKTNSLARIEQTLNALTRTPTRHRLDLKRRIKIPVISQLHFKPQQIEDGYLDYTKTLESFERVYSSLKITEDPYYLSLVIEDTEKSRRKLEKLRLNEKTWCRQQMKMISNTAKKLYHELGGWAADYYLSRVASNVKKLLENYDSISASSTGIEYAEKQYLAKAFGKVEISSTDFFDPQCLPMVTDKVAKLIEALLSEPELSFGIVFVQERAVASVLAHLLSIHPLTRVRFRPIAILGSSIHQSRFCNIGELDTEAKDALLSFKSGKTNLAVATSVLEEGVDIPTCNLVVCFQKPANLKSYIQRRGRARCQDSKLILLVDSHYDDLVKFHELEEEMRAVYSDETRTLPKFVIEDAEESRDRMFKVECTGAILELDNAVSHLHHFCATLPRHNYVSREPEFICSEESDGSITARVHLPISVNEAVRTATSQRSWKSEKGAIKDACFEACMALLKAGLISDHLLPVFRHDAVAEDLKTSTVETRASVIEIDKQMNPWIDVATAWLNDPSAAYQSAITFNGLSLDIFLSVPPPPVRPFKVYWDSKTIMTVCLGSDYVKKQIKASGLTRLSDETRALLQSAMGHRLGNLDGKEFLVKFLAQQTKPLSLNMGQRQAVTEDVSRLGSPGIIRFKNVAYIFKELKYHNPAAENIGELHRKYDESLIDGPQLLVERLTRRRNFRHPVVSAGLPPTKTHSNVLPMFECTMDAMPFKFVQFGMMIPSIMWNLEIGLIASQLSEVLLAPVQISDLSLVVTAITAPSAHEVTNYQRLEFLGDSILKFCTAIQIMAEHPQWHEGFLSRQKDHVVANSRLARAAMERGIERFIITTEPNDSHWQLPDIESILAEQQAREKVKRKLSSKVVADVVESLIGASMLDGGIPKALTCLQIFLPEIDWQPLEDRRQSLYDQAPAADLPPTLTPLLSLIGYTFRQPSLLIQAITHGSYCFGPGSLERLEFLGDAILDYIVVQEFFRHNLSHIQMHELRTALVNADLLATVCMEMGFTLEVNELAAAPTNGSPMVLRTQNVPIPLWKFMRYHSTDVMRAQQLTLERYKRHRSAIQTALTHGTQYPWAELSSVMAEKFFSDLVESLLGAIWIDSGDLNVVRGVVERMGILRLVTRSVEEEFSVEHPKVVLGKMAVDQTVDYILEENKEAERGLVCRVFVGDRLVAHVEGGKGREEIQNRAAVVAIEKLKKELVES